MKKSFWLLFVLVFVLVLVVIKTPAAWAIYGLQKAAPSIKTSGVSGTLWQGAVNNSYWSERGETFPLGRLQWSFKPQSLLSLSPCFELSSVYLSQKMSGQVCYSPLSSSMSASDLDISLPLENISPMLEVDVRGKIDGLVTQVAWDGQQFTELDANLLWQEAAINNGSRWVSLGNLQAKASDNNGGVNSIISSVRGDQAPPINVEVNANVRDLVAAPKVSVTGTVGLTNDSRSLRPMMQFIGDETRRDTFNISIEESF